MPASSQKLPRAGRALRPPPRTARPPRPQRPDGNMRTQRPVNARLHDHIDGSCCDAAKLRRGVAKLGSAAALPQHPQRYGWCRQALPEAAQRQVLAAVRPLDLPLPVLVPKLRPKLRSFTTIIHFTCNQAAWVLTNTFSPTCRVPTCLQTASNPSINIPLGQVVAEIACALTGSERSGTVISIVYSSSTTTGASTPSCVSPSRSWTLVWLTTGLTAGLPQTMARTGRSRSKWSRCQSTWLPRLSSAGGTRNFPIISSRSYGSQA